MYVYHGSNMRILWNCLHSNCSLFQYSMFIWIYAFLSTEKKMLDRFIFPAHYTYLHSRSYIPRACNEKGSTCLTILHSSNIFISIFLYSILFLRIDFGKPLFYVLLRHSLGSPKVRYNLIFHYRIMYPVYIITVVV
jgi:hypothetical protein